MSKSTSKSQHKKTKRSNRYWKLILVILIGIFLASASFIVIKKRNSYVKENENCLKTQQNGQCDIKLEYAKTGDEQVQGLSGRSSLPQDSGMLFVFVTPDEQCFWMKDMKFPLDIIWLNSDKQVVYMQQNLAPETFPQTYCPGTNVQYVLEVNAGKAQSLGIEKGEQLYF